MNEAIARLIVFKRKNRVITDLRKNISFNRFEIVNSLRTRNSFLFVYLINWLIYMHKQRVIFMNIELKYEYFVSTETRLIIIKTKPIAYIKFSHWDYEFDCSHYVPLFNSHLFETTARSSKSTNYGILLFSIPSLTLSFSKSLAFFLVVVVVYLEANQWKQQQQQWETSKPSTYP